jgi:ADP-ribosylglycohydrolase
MADSILNGTDYADTMREYYQKYPRAGYGGNFHKWARDESAGAYNSYGNGSAMRTSPVAYAFDSLPEVLEMAEYYASPTHDHPEGVKGAQATSASIFMARTGSTKNEIREYVTETFGYDLTLTVDEIRPDYKFEVCCMKTVPQAIVCFLESDSFEDSIRNAISIGGNSDTLACITGSIAGAYEGMTNDLSQKTMSLLDDDLQNVVIDFHDRFIPEHKLQRTEHKPASAFTEVSSRQYFAVPKRSIVARLFG